MFSKVRLFPSSSRALRITQSQTFLYFHANIDESGREVEKDERNGDGREEIFDLAEADEGILELDILAAAGEIGVDVFQNTSGSSGREAGEREAGNDAIGFLKTVFFQIYIDFFGAVADDDQAGIVYIFSIFRPSAGSISKQRRTQSWRIFFNIFFVMIPAPLPSSTMHFAFRKSIFSKAFCRRESESFG